MRQEIRQLLAAQQQMLLQLPRRTHTDAASIAASNEPANGVLSARSMAMSCLCRCHLEPRVLAALLQQRCM